VLQLCNVLERAQQIFLKYCLVFIMILSCQRLDSDRLQTTFKASMLFTAAAQEDQHSSSVAHLSILCATAVRASFFVTDLQSVTLNYRF